MKTIDNQCVECGRELDTSVWNGECQNCEPQDEETQRKEDKIAGEEKEFWATDEKDTYTNK